MEETAVSEEQRILRRKKGVAGSKEGKVPPLSFAEELLNQVDVNLRIMDNKVSVFRDKCLEFHNQSVLDAIKDAQNPKFNSEQVMKEKTEFLVITLSDFAEYLRCRDSGTHQDGGCTQR